MNQGPLKNQSFFDTDMFKNAQGVGGLVEDPAKKPPATNAPADPNAGDALGQGMNPGMRLDMGQPGMDQPGMGMGGGGHNPVVAQPTGTVPGQEMQEEAEGENFWGQLAQALSPFLQKRNLKPMGDPKMTDRNENKYELLLGPKTDPRTGLPMQLPESDPDQLYRDANELARTTGGRIQGLPFIDDNQIWHIPLQMGGSSGQKAVSKAKNNGR